MKIVFLDSDAINKPNDLSWEPLQKLGDFSHYNATFPKDFWAHAGDADAVLSVRSELNADVIRSAPNLKYIGMVATGYDKVNIEAANQAGITVTNIISAAITAPAIAQSAMALLLALTNKVAYYSSPEAISQWQKESVFVYANPDYPIIDLKDKTLGLVGYGNIAQLFAKTAQAMGMRIIATTRSGQLTPRLGCHAEYRNLPDLLRESDVLSLHCPATPDTLGMINEETISLMKTGALLINTARGSLIDEAALKKALVCGKLAGAGVDVLSSEPPRNDNPLLTAPRCAITPHNGWTSMEVRQKFLMAGVANLVAYIAGRPQNVVNNPVQKAVAYQMAGGCDLS